MKNLENKIINDIIKNKTLVKEIKEADPDDLLFFHYGLGTYVRNQYLWSNPENIKKLSALYGTDNVDSISSCIVEKLYFKTTGKKIKRD